MKLKYINHEKIIPNNLKSIPYLCEDMSVKQSEKKYKKSNGCIKDHPQFGYIQLYYIKDPLLYVTTPPMKCLFGVQNNNGSFNMSLQFTDINEDERMRSFYNFIQAIEFECMKNIGISMHDDDCFISQIKHDKKNRYDPNLNVKLPFSYNKFQVDIYSDKYDNVNLFQISKFTPMECDIYIDKIWKINDKFYVKWKCKVIKLI